MSFTRRVVVEPESESIPLSTLDVCPGDGKPAVNVHKHLLYGRAYETGKIRTAESEEEFQRPTTQDSEGRDSTDYRIVVGLEHHRSLVLYARWIYGRPMWDSANCTNPKGDLECLTDIYDLCAGDHNGDGRDYEAINACLDAIREMLICDFSPAKPLKNPLGILLPSLPPASAGRNTVVDLLAFGVCADEGWTETWHENWYAKLDVFGDDERWFHVALSKALARSKKTSGDKPDPMVRCAYHEHPSVGGRLRCEQGIWIL